MVRRNRVARPKKTDQIVRTILQRVFSGRWPPGEALPANRQLAGELEVALLTVQRAIGEMIEAGVLDSQPRQRVVVSVAGRQRAEELLHQNGQASGLERLTLLLCEEYLGITDPSFYWNQVIREMAAEAALRGLETSVVGFPIKGQVEFVRSLSGLRRNVSVVMGVHYDHMPGLQEASLSGIPIILHNRWVPWLHLPTVQRDDYAAAWRVGEILRSLGHRNMCMISAIWPSLLWGRARHDGWVAFLIESGLFTQCNPAQLTTPYIYDQSAYLRRIMSGPEAPTAVVFALPPTDWFFDEACWGKLDIPRQLSVVTWDENARVGLPGAEVPSTNVYVDHRRMAQCIIEMAGKVQAGDLCPPSIRVRCEIDVTSSIGPPRNP